MKDFLPAERPLLLWILATCEVFYSPCIIVRRYPAENGIRVKVVDAVVDLVAGANEELVAQFRELAARKLAVTVRIEERQAFLFTEIKKEPSEVTGQKM